MRRRTRFYLHWPVSCPPTFAFKQNIYENWRSSSRIQSNYKFNYVQCSNLQKSYPIVNLLHSTYFFETNFSVFLRQTLSYFETNFRVYHVHSLQNQMANTGAIFFFYKAELLQVGIFFCTQFPSLGFYINRKVWNGKN